MFNYVMGSQVEHDNLVLEVLKDSREIYGLEAKIQAFLSIPHRCEIDLLVEFEDGYYVHEMKSGHETKSKIKKSFRQCRKAIERFGLTDKPVLMFYVSPFGGTYKAIYKEYNGDC